MGRLAGKLAIVTGGSSGIGRAIAVAFGKEGACVFLTTKSDEAAAMAACATIEQSGAQASYMLLDVEEHDAVERLFATVEDRFRVADVLVNNAATATRTPFLEMSEEEYQRTMHVNLAFPFFATKRFASALIDEDAPGSVINIGSISGVKAISRMSAYQCSKAALLMLSRGAAYELAGHGIRVNTISPGLTATKSNADQWRDNPEVWLERGRYLPLGRAGRPGDMAGAAVFLASDESGWMTGGEIVVDGGDSVI